jgi:sulfur-oxidizing protein SoxX
MTNTLKIAALALAAGFIALPFNASAQTAPKSADPALVDAYVKATFGKAPPEWQERIVPDETLKTCNAFHNNVPSKEADAIVKRELAKVVYPADGKFLGDWKEGRKVANNGRGGQFSDPPGTVAAATAMPAISWRNPKSPTARWGRA